MLYIIFLGGTVIAIVIIHINCSLYNFANVWWQFSLSFLINLVVSPSLILIFKLSTCYLKWNDFSLLCSSLNVMNSNWYWLCIGDKAYCTIDVPIVTFWNKTCTCRYSRSAIILHFSWGPCCFRLFISKCNLCQKVFNQFFNLQPEIN